MRALFQKITITFGLFLVFSIFFSSAGAQEIPPPPHAFYGYTADIQINGQPANAGGKRLEAINSAGSVVQSTLVPPEVWVLKIDSRINKIRFRIGSAISAEFNVQAGGLTQVFLRLFSNQTPTPMVELIGGWNLVTYSGPYTTPADFAAQFGNSVKSIYKWSAYTQNFSYFISSGPIFLNTLSSIMSGDAIWIYINRSVSWSRPAFSGTRLVVLRPGWNLVSWTGPNTASVTEVFSFITTPYSIFKWDTINRVFLRFSSTVPHSLNSITALNHGDAVWVFLQNAIDPISWTQPAP